MVFAIMIILQVLLFNRVISKNIKSIQFNKYIETTDDNYPDEQKIKVDFDDDSSQSYNVYHSDKGSTPDPFSPSEAFKEKPLRIIIVYGDQSKTGKEIKFDKQSTKSSDGYSLTQDGDSIIISGDNMVDVGDSQISFKKTKSGSNILYLGIFDDDALYLQSVAVSLKKQKVNVNPHILSVESQQPYAEAIEAKEMTVQGNLAGITSEDIILNLPVLDNKQFTLKKSTDKIWEGEKVYYQVNGSNDMIFIFKDSLNSKPSSQAPNYLGKLDTSLFGSQDNVNQFQVVYNQEDNTISFVAARRILLDI